MRVGERTDYNKLHIEVETDGSLSPSSALHKAAIVLRDHFEKVSDIPVKDNDSGKSGEKKEETEKKRGKTKKDS